MSPPPNEVYTVFSFIGFVLCTIPLYWHLEGKRGSTTHVIAVLILKLDRVAWNVGTCLYMTWTGLGCLFQCVNSIVWNKNMIDRAPVYCDICTSFSYALSLRSLTLRHATATHIQIALNVAVPASSLCINRQLYRAASMKTAGTTDIEKRRILICDLLIGVGIPVLQMVAGECA